MAFVVGKLAIIVLRPSNLLLLLGLLGLLGCWGRRRRWAMVALLGSLGGLALAGALPLGNWLATPLENRFPHPGYPARIDGAVVLGGGILSGLTQSRGLPALGDPAERYLAMLELARRYPEARLVFTGGVGRLGGGVPAEAQTVGLILEQQGLPGRVLLEDRARTTRENALFARELAQPQPGSTWLLVTSAAHMPRSVGVFRQAGWDVLPWPVDYRTAGDYGLGGFGLAVGDHLYELDEAAYEWLGLVYYRLLGWTDVLFPGPLG